MLSSYVFYLVIVTKYNATEPKECVYYVGVGKYVVDVCLEALQLKRIK